MYNKLLAIVLIIFCTLTLIVKGQNPPPPISDSHNVIETKSEDNISTDSIIQSNYQSNNPIYLKPIDSTYQSKYQSNEFNYEIREQKITFWQRLKNKIIHFLESILGDLDPGIDINKSMLYLILKVIGFVILGGVILFLLRFFISSNRKNIFSKKNKKLDINPEELNENIHEINFPETILNYESKQDYRSAVRYQFLFLLKKLNHKNYIEWNPEKTNRDYVKDIKEPQLKKNYLRWSYIFENVWYGEFEITNEQYQQFKYEFESAKI